MEEVYLMNHYVKKWRSKISPSTTEDQGSQSNRKQSEPTLVLSVIGDSKTLVPNQWPKDVFQKALIETAKSEKETWILYRGGTDGVSKVVEEAYQDYDSFECFMDSWSRSNGRNHVQKDFWSSRNGWDHVQERRIKLISTTNKEGDDSSIYAEKIFQNMKDDPSFLRFETFISQQKIFYSGPDMVFEITVPTAIIVCEGDVQTISHISEALEKQLPVIIMKGSGKAADLVLDYLHVDKCKESVIKEKFRLLFGYKFDKEEYKVIKKHLKCIKRNKELVGVFDLHNDHPLKLSGIVGEAVVRFLSVKIYQIYLEDASNSGDYIHLETKAYVMNPRFSTPLSLPLYFTLEYTVLQENEEFMKNCGKRLLFEALKANRCEYVSSLIDYGVALTPMDIRNLYKWQSAKENKLVKQFFEENKNINKNGDVEFVIAVRNACRMFLKYEEYYPKKHNSDVKIDISDVLLWAIIFNRRELAELCWLKGEDHLWISLICSVILKRFSKKIRDDGEDIIADALKEHSKIFEERCSSMLDKMSEEHSDIALNVLKRITSVWGICSTPLVFAYENSVYDVVAHTCTKNYLKRKMKVEPRKCLQMVWPFSSNPYYANVTYNTLGLLLYSWFVLTSTSTEYNVEGSMRILEYYVYLWRFGDLVQEIWQFVFSGRCASRLNWKFRLAKYFYNLWNLLDWFSHITLALAIFLRQLLQKEEQIYARNMFALSLLSTYLRFLEAFLISKKAGTIVIMIKEMLKDLWRFILIVLFMVLGVGVYYHANLWPDHQALWSSSLSNWRIWTIMSHSYWQLYGEVDLEFLTGSNQDNCSNNRSIWEADPSMERCPQQDWTVPVIAGIYMMFTNLLLVNIVIAKFSNTFERIHTNSEAIWNFHLFTVYEEYIDRIAPPFNLLVVLPTFLFRCKHWMSSCLCKVSGVDDVVLVRVTERKEYPHVWQKTMALEIYRKARTMTTTVDSQVKARK